MGAMHQVLVWSLDAAGKASRDTHAFQARCGECTWKGKVHRVGVSSMTSMMSAQAEKHGHEATTKT